MDMYNPGLSRGQKRLTQLTLFAFICVYVYFVTQDRFQFETASFDRLFEFSLGCFLAIGLIPIHECIHFILFKFFKYNPKFHVSFHSLELFVYTHERIAIKPFLFVLSGPFCFLVVLISGIGLKYPYVSIGLMLSHILHCWFDFKLIVRLFQIIRKYEYVRFEKKSKSLIID